MTEEVIPCEDDYDAIHWCMRVWNRLSDHDKANRSVFEIILAPCDRATLSPDLDHAELVANCFIKPKDRTN